MDKFPLGSDHSDQYAYFGRRTASNMFSELAPYRRLIGYIDNPGQSNVGRVERGRSACDLMNSIGLGSTVKFRFRRGRNSKAKLGSASDQGLDLTVTLDDLAEAQALTDRTAQVREGLIHISGVTFRKEEREVDLMDLSSGERNYVLMILALSFSVVDGCTVLFDEPENSLHPKWQARIMSDMWALLSALSDHARLVVATHSPLMVSGLVNRESYILDLPEQTAWASAILSGNATDVILKRQFGMESARSMSFLKAIQDCVEALVVSETEPGRFRTAATALFSLGVSMDVDDPLYQTVEDIRAQLEQIT